VKQGLLNGSETVEDLDLDNRRRDRAAPLGDVQVDVGIATQRALLHFAIGDLHIAERQPQLLEAPARVGQAADVRLGDDLEERNARTVQVDLGEAAVAMGQLAGVFLEMDPCQAATASAATVLAHRNLEVTTPRK